MLAATTPIYRTTQLAIQHLSKTSGKTPTEATQSSLPGLLRNVAEMEQTHLG